MMKRIYFILAFLWLFASFGYCQTVSNVDAYQEGKTIVITYDLDKAGAVGAVYCSMDGGRTWGYPLKQVSGDIDKEVLAGSHRIVWDVLSERESLKGDNVCFKVEAGLSIEKFKVKGVTFEMVCVDGGTFTMGATSEQGSDSYDSEKPTHQVTLSSYYIGKTEVTQALWEAVMGKSVSQIASENGWKTNGVGANYPMYYVSWDDCQEFIRKLNALTGQNFRLPTEAEWEYAARGGSKSLGYKYSGSNNISDVVWYTSNSGDKTHPVGTKAPNELGVYDMSGNVYEWCSDWHGGYSSASQTNPKGPKSGTYRVLRGGSWCDDAGFCRVSDRGGSNPTYRYEHLGLRLAR